MQVEHKVGCSVKAVSLCSGSNDDLSVGAAGDDRVAVGVGDIVGDFGGVGLAFGCGAGIDHFFGAHRHSGADG